jgi:hypothetical protein
MGVAVAAAAGCQGLSGDGDDDDEVGAAEVTVEVPLEGIPPDGECAHIIATRLSDFRVSSYQGALAGAVFQARTGEHRVTAVAYPPPCGDEPVEPPWIADEQVVIFSQGPNTLALNFRTNVGVGVDPIFWDDVDPQLVVLPGSTQRIGRNFEDTAGPSYALDGWDVLQIALPPNGGGGTPSTTFIFSTQTAGSLPYTPRGMARMVDGRFVFQLSESNAALRVFASGGAFLESWPVVLDPGMMQFDSTDGLDRVDATHLVRTAFLNTPLDCPEFSGPDCIQSAIEILEIRPDGGGGSVAAVTQQILLPFPYNVEYPLGVVAAPIAGRYIISTLPGGTGSRLMTLDSTGAVVAGPVDVAVSLEGLFINGPATKLGTLSYEGNLAMRTTTTLALRAGEFFDYALGFNGGLSNPVSLAWRATGGRFVVLHGFNLLDERLPDFTDGFPVPFDPSPYIALSGVDVDDVANQLLVVDRIPPIDPGTGQRLAMLDALDADTGVRLSSTVLQGVPANVRARTLAYMPATNQVITHYRRPGNPPDAIDSTIFVHNLDGSLASIINLAAWGVHVILDLNVLPATGEIVLLGTDVSGTVRLMVTTAGGTPVRSYRTDTIFGITDLAPITNGPFAGQVGVITGQPSSFLRIEAP